MTDEFEPLQTEGTDQTIKIENIIRKVIVTAGANPTAVAMPATIRRDDPECLLELVLQRAHERSPTARLI